VTPERHVLVPASHASDTIQRHDEEKAYGASVSARSGKKSRKLGRIPFPQMLEGEEEREEAAYRTVKGIQRPACC
jgi:hypothetical protein